jgi:hypothetical protein
LFYFEWRVAGGLGVDHDLNVRDIRHGIDWKPGEVPNTQSRDEDDNEEDRASASNRQIEDGV